MSNPRTTADAAFVAHRRDQEEIEYLRGVTDPERAPRLAPAMLALRTATARDTPWVSAVAEALRASDITTKTIDNLIRKLIKHGFLTRTGTYDRTYDRADQRWEVRDSRVLVRGDWPLDGTTSPRLRP